MAERTPLVRRRVAITGIGVVTKGGIGAEAFWDSLLGPAPVGPRSIDDWDPTPWFDNPKEARRTDRFAQFALSAAAQALEQSGDPVGDPQRRGVWVGTGVGGLISIEEQVIVNHEKGARRVSPFLVPMMMANAAAAAVSMRYGWQGPCENTVTACAAGTMSIGNGARLIAHGRCDAVIAGSTEAAMTATGIAGFTNMTAMSSSGVSMPFDKNRDGFMLAEGGGIVVLEEWDAAVARGATILGEVLGSASTADAHHITAPSPGGMGAINAIELALEDAGISAADIKQVNAHGTSTPLNDAAEAAAISKVFGDKGVPVTSIKGITGHSLGGAGSIEAVSAVLSIQKGLIPPTVGYETVDPEMAPIDIVAGGPREWTPGPIISNSFGFGGHNACVVIAPAS